VNDAAAARAAFYTLQDLRNGDAPAEALRKAQLGLMTAAGLDHPALWAPFAMIGPGPTPAPRTARAG
jgi:CHAT domain-containing protein